MRARQMIAFVTKNAARTPADAFWGEKELVSHASVGDETEETPFNNLKWSAAYARVSVNG